MSSPVGPPKRPAPYALFDGWPQDAQGLAMRAPDGTFSFEPSAVATRKDPRSGREQVLLFSDFYDPTQYTYELGKGDQLRPAANPRPEIHLQGAKEPFAPKFEAVTRLSDGRYLATTPFNRDGAAFRQVMFLEQQPQGPVAKLADFDSAALESYVAAAFGKPWRQIEGLEVDAAGRNVTFGVRFVGESREDKDKLPVVALVRSPLAGDKIGAPDQLIRFSTEAALGRREGLADLHRLKDGSWLILTSHEGNDFADPANNAGHLFKVSAEELQNAASAQGEVPLGAPIAEFAAKPEGITTLEDGRLFVVFDDDREWKDGIEGYARSRAMYTVIDPG